jgi:ribosomal-protein-alanine N-acetyltransferase
MALLVRPATSADVPALLDLERQCVTAAHWHLQDYARIFADGLPPRLALVLEQSGRTIGFIVAATLGPEWEIENVAVAPEHQRRGLGRLLIRELLDLGRQRGAECVFLEVRESNLSARVLYEKCRFVEAGRRKDYYSGPVEDAILYRRDCF